jgi:hypothetical protein
MSCDAGWKSVYLAVDMINHPAGKCHSDSAQTLTVAAPAACVLLPS